ncbi:SDR family oxidoreductase [Kibdelosporangium philippinense]|uniref:SDR family oxidoreductase n=1 Tax=Kibdelosporangium philippinense TaxID=211113 RepID=A0ABS8Z2Q6_9PSEU|nr:SDR family NAD(P)-dependent oxidoreductase [Kibdelosporangium philippinense]MCE7002120.1 SDR family oxidoreductase [Kibdelosporangium philippinense]
MQGRFNGKGFVVTGGTRGIGRAIVLGAAADGARVVFCGRSESASVGAEVEAAARAAGGEARFVPADVAVEADVERLFDVAVEWLDEVHVVVNNAGVARDSLLVQTTLEDWRHVLDVNLRGPFLTCRRAVEEMLSHGGGGRIVNVASFTANGLAGAVSYAASKAALLSLTRSVAKEYGRRRIFCNAVVPGFVETDMTTGYPAAARAALAQLSPYARFGLAEEVAGTVLFLASDEASFVTGDAVYVAGAVRDVPRITA